MAGTTKQDYLISKALNKDIVVQGNPKTFRGLKKYISDLCLSLKLYSEKNIPLDNDESLELLEYICEVLEGLNESYSIKTHYKE